MPWGDEFETLSLYLHERVPGTREHCVFDRGEWTVDRIKEILKPHLSSVLFDVVEVEVPTGVSYEFKASDWSGTVIDRDVLARPRHYASRYLRRHIAWLRRRADELEREHAELLAETKQFE